MTEEYVAPRNATADLVNAAAPENRAILHHFIQETRKQNPIGEWPDEPYHYGMGRIMAYEMWLARLSKEDAAKEIAASRARYEAHYDKEAALLIDIFREGGIEIDRRDEVSPEEKSRFSHRQERELGSSSRRPSIPSLAGETKRETLTREQDENTRNLIQMLTIERLTRQALERYAQINSAERGRRIGLKVEQSAAILSSPQPDRPRDGLMGFVSDETYAATKNRSQQRDKGRDSGLSL